MSTNAVAQDTIVQNVDMTTNVVAQDTMDWATYMPTEIAEEPKRLLRLYWIIDNWRDDIELLELQKFHAQILRSQLNRLVHYYFERGQRNKAKLAVTLRGATFYAEDIGLNHTQIDAIQSLLIYFQRVHLSIDNLRECHWYLLENDIYTLPEMPNWQAAIADH